MCNSCHTVTSRTKKKIRGVEFFVFFLLFLHADFSPKNFISAPPYFDLVRLVKLLYHPSTTPTQRALQNAPPQPAPRLVYSPVTTPILCDSSQFLPPKIPPN